MLFPDTVKESFARIKEQEPQLLVRFITEQCVNCCLAGEAIQACIVIARALGGITTAYVSATQRALFGTCCGTHANNIKKSLIRRLLCSPKQEQYERLIEYCLHFLAGKEAIQEEFHILLKRRLGAKQLTVIFSQFPLERLRFAMREDLFHLLAAGSSAAG